MAITANWNTLTFSVPQADLTLISGTLYEMNTETQFRQNINALMASAEGIVFEDPIRHNTEVTIAGTTFARTIEMINGYSLTFTPDSQWTVRYTGSNNNLFDVENGILNQNQVQVISANSAGLIVNQGIAISQADLDNIADAVWDEVINGGTHNASQSSGRRLRQLAEAGTYANGSVWIDTINGTAGTDPFENGAEVFPVNSIADANTIAAAVGLARFTVLPGSSITLAATQSNQSFFGNNWTLALGGQNIAGTYVEGAVVSGTVSGAGTRQIYSDCILNNTSHLKGTAFRTCTIVGTQTITEAGDYRFRHCVSGVAGAGAPTIDMGAGVGASTLELRDWRGGITLNNLAAGDVVTLDGIFGTITLNGADAQVEIRGLYKEVVNNLTGSPTVNDAGANISSVVSLTDTLEGAHSVGDSLRIIMAALAGKLSGAPTGPINIRDVADSKNRITATVDANGNRTAITTLDGT